MNIKPSLALLLLFCILFPALVVRINTNLVQVDIVVTKDGKLVTDLTADDFEGTGSGPMGRLRDR